MKRRRIILPVLAMLVASSASAFDKQATPSEGAILFFGDSITEGWMDAVKYPSFAFPAVCDSLLRSGGVHYLTENLGNAGETTEDALGRIERDVLSRHPAVVVIAFGSNDWYVHGFATEPRVPLARFESNLRLLVWKLQGVGIAPILLGLPPVIPERYYRYSSSALYTPFGGVAAHRAAYDDAVTRVASLTRVPCVSIAFDTSDGTSMLGIDGLHPTASAHRMIAAALRQPIEEAVQRGGNRPTMTPGLLLFPQPVRPDHSTRIIVRFATEYPATVHFRIFDATGRERRGAEYTALTAGTQHVELDCTDTFGVPLPRGVYFLSLQESDMFVNTTFIIL